MVAYVPSRRSAIVRRRPLVLTAAAALVLTVTTTGGPMERAAADDLVGPVPNGGFEEPVADGAIPGWTQTFGATPAFTVVDAPVHEGAASVQMVDESGTDSAGLQSDLFPIVGGQSYDFSAWVNREVGFTSLFVYFHDADGERLGEVVETFQTPVGTWSPIAVTASAPPEATQAALLLYSSGVVVTTAHFDDVTVAEAADPVTWELTNLGTPINNVAIDKVAYGTSPDGRPIFYAVLLGGDGTTHLHMVDILSGESVRRVPLPAAIGSRDLAVAPDGTVYMATFTDGRLFHYDPVEDVMTDLGRPAPDVQYLFGLSIHPDGTVFVGAYPTGRLYSYDPGAATFRDYGQVSTDSQYTRSIVVWEDSLLVGLGTQRARLFEVDIDSGAMAEIPLPAPYADEHEVNQVTLRDGVAYVHLTASRTMLRYDPAAGEWLTPVGPAAGLDVSPVAPSGRKEAFYVGTDAMLHAFSPRSGRTRTIDAFTGMFSSRGFAWVDLQRPGQRGESLVMVDYIGRLWVYNPRSREGSVELLDIQGEPTHIRSLGLGPDGKVWAGGLGSGGLSSYDPASGELDQVPRGTVGQSDQMLTIGDDLYLGTYPGANLLRYDPAQPFDWGANPESVVGLAGDGQDRPMALAEAAGRIVIGTVPNYGQLSGAISVYDPATGDTAVDRGVSGERSVVSIVPDGDIVYASTSAWGGLGIDPAPVDGTVFAYDPVSGTKLWEVVPVPGMPAVTELAMSPTGTIWGLTRGLLFEVDPASQEILRTVAVPEENWDTVDHVWSEGSQLGVASDGTVYAEVGGELLRVNPDTGTTTQLTNFVSAFVMASDTEFYLSRGSGLYRLELTTP